jgi:hypothetical protein
MANHSLNDFFGLGLRMEAMVVEEIIHLSTVSKHSGGNYFKKLDGTVPLRSEWAETTHCSCAR